MKKAFAQLHTAVFLAGFTAILGKLIQLNEGLLVWYRLLFSIVLLGFIAFYRKEFKRISRTDFFQIFGVSMILASHWVAFYGSIKYANASVAVVCISAAGFFSSLFEPIITGKRFVWVEMILGLLSLLGIYIIFDFHPQYKVGIIFGMFAAIGSAIFPIYNKKLLQKFTPQVLTFYEFVGGIVFLTFLLPFYFYSFGAPDYVLPKPTDLVWLLVLCVFCTVWAFQLQLSALKKISAFTSNLTYNLEPLYGIILAFLILGEGKSFHPQFYYGILLILAAVTIQMYRVIRHSKIKGKQS